MPVIQRLFPSQTVMEYQIGYLADHADAVAALARWHHDEWATRTPEISIGDRAARFTARAQRGGLPMGFVAIVGGQVVGLACLVECDLESHAHLSPWLASVVVAPEYRGHGLGSALCKRATDEAGVLGFQRAYLFTSDKQHLYRRLGWSTLEGATWRGHQVTIMVRELAG